MAFIKKWFPLIDVILLVLIIWLALRPPRFLLNLTKRADLSDPLASGQQMIEKYGCRGCHLIGGGALWSAQTYLGWPHALEKITCAPSCVTRVPSGVTAGCPTCASPIRKLQLSSSI